jgi:hypothetical protein
MSVDNDPVINSVLTVGGALAATLALALVYRIAERPTGGAGTCSRARS